jgi:hypothetical protein
MHHKLLDIQTDTSAHTHNHSNPVTYSENKPWQSLGNAKFIWSLKILAVSGGLTTRCVW